MTASSLILLGLALAGAAGVAWPLWGYGCLLRVIAARHRPPERAGGSDPMEPVTVLLAVHNERDGVRARIQNLLDSDLAPERLRIVVASDASTDGTDEVVRGLADPRVTLVRSEPRGGKSMAQNAGLATIEGGIVVITDCGTTFDRRTLPELAAPFADPDIGAVDGCLSFEPPPNERSIRAHGAYWNYEGRVRTCESTLGILATASGAVMAARRSLIGELPAHAGDDCVIPLMVVAAGSRVHRSNRALAWDESNADPRAEFRSRVRMVVRNWQGTWMYPRLLTPWRHPAVAFGLWSHKLLRWIVPFSVLLSLAAMTALGITAGPGWAWLAVSAWLVTSLGAIDAGLALRAPRRHRSTPLGSFLLICVAFATGLVKSALGHRIGGYRDRTAPTVPPASA